MSVRVYGIEPRGSFLIVGGCKSYCRMEVTPFQSLSFQHLLVFANTSTSHHLLVPIFIVLEPAQMPSHSPNWTSQHSHEEWRWAFLPCFRGWLWYFYSAPILFPLTLSQTPEFLPVLSAQRAGMGLIHPCHRYLSWTCLHSYQRSMRVLIFICMLALGIEFSRFFFLSFQI